MKTFHNVVNAIVCCAKEGKARALIVLDIEWVQLVLQNREILQNYRFKQGKKEQILSKVCMIKKGPHGTVYLRRDEEKYGLKAGLHATRFVAKIYLWSKLVEHKKIRPDFLFWPLF